MSFVLGPNLVPELAKQLGLVDSVFHGPLPEARRFIIYASGGGAGSPWDFIEYDEGAVVITVLDPQMQNSLCEACGIAANGIITLVIDIEDDSLVRYTVGIAMEPKNDVLAETLAEIVGKPGTVTHLPAGVLSATGVRVSETVIGKRPDISPAPRPYADLDWPGALDALKRGDISISEGPLDALDAYDFHVPRAALRRMPDITLEFGTGADEAREPMFRQEEEPDNS